MCIDFLVFYFKQKTAYELRISDWSSDVCSSDLISLAPGSACTQTYFIAGMFDTREETENYAYYLATKFVRFLVLQRKLTQHVTPDRFRFVPMLDMKRRWTDAQLYRKFGLTADERDYIERSIKPRSVNLSLDSPIPARDRQSTRLHSSH